MKSVNNVNPMFTASAVACSVLLAASQADASLLYGLDAKNETSALAGDATFNEYTGFGVDITAPSTLANWLSATASPVPTTSLSLDFNVANAKARIVADPTGMYGITMTYKVDLTGSHDVTFDKFAIGFQRGGAATSNIVGPAAYSTDGINFFGATVDEVAVGNRLGTDNVGPADTITTFRTPDGFGGTIDPQQVYVVGGLGAAGTLNSGSFYIQLTVGPSSNNQTTLTLLDDRYDVTTTAMALAANNVDDVSINPSGDDGYDIAWFGSAVAVPEPTSAALGLLGGLALLAARRRA